MRGKWETRNAARREGAPSRNNGLRRAGKQSRPSNSWRALNQPLFVFSFPDSSSPPHTRRRGKKKPRPHGSPDGFGFHRGSCRGFHLSEPVVVGSPRAFIHGMEGPNSSRLSINPRPPCHTCFNPSACSSPPPPPYRGAPDAGFLVYLLASQPEFTEILGEGLGKPQPRHRIDAARHIYHDTHTHNSYVANHVLRSICIHACLCATPACDSTLETRDSTERKHSSQKPRICQQLPACMFFFLSHKNTRDT